MANLDMVREIAGPAVVGVLSASAELLEDNSFVSAVANGKDPTKRNFLYRHAGVIGDSLLAVLTVGNYVGGFDVLGRGAAELSAAGIAVGARRAAQTIGSGVLGIQTVASQKPKKSSTTSNKRVFERAPSAIVFGGGANGVGPAREAVLDF